MKSCRETANRTRRGRLQKAAQGGYSGGGAPYGSQSSRGSKVLAVNEDEARTVRKVFSLHRRGLSPHRIANALNEAGILTRTGEAWRGLPT